MLAVWLCSSPLQVQAALEVTDLLQLSLEELANLQITSVSRREENLSRAAASIFVITADDIRRSGATTVPEILRLAPNLQVARIDSVRYAITARGFNNAVGNKLLVLIDGRTVYTPLFSGVFWEMQDTMLQDIDRIEVISGPGATLWGANAVNGVINIITRPAAATNGTLLSGEAGDREQGLALRTGGTTDGQLQWRVYAKAREWDNTRMESGAEVRDGWKKQQAGFRIDWQSAADSFTVQGDVIDGESEHRGFAGTLEIPAVEISDMNLLTRWNRNLGENSDLRIQAYWSRSEREEFVLFSPKADIFDLEFQHSFALGRQQFLWGGGYRQGRDDVDPGVFTAILPKSRNLDWQNIFIQDEITLRSNLNLTAGLKLEWNDYTGMEYLPSLRLGWDATASQFIWAAVSRAVRAPSRFDRDTWLPLTPPFIIAGGPDFVAEVAKVSEIGYRAMLGSAFNISVTFFHHDWEKLRSGTPLPFPTYLSNGIRGEATGLETWMQWQMNPSWRISGGLTTLDKDLEFYPGSGDTVGVNNSTLHNDPDFQWMLRSSTELPGDFMLDLNLRRIAALPVEPVPAYTELNARLAWLHSQNFELTLTGRNLLENDHAEFGREASRSRIDRSILLGVRWSL